LWADAVECKPISGSEHYENALDYIARHVKRGAVVYLARAINPLADFDPNDLLVE